MYNGNGQCGIIVAGATGNTNLTVMTTTESGAVLAEFLPDCIQRGFLQVGSRPSNVAFLPTAGKLQWSAHVFIPADVMYEIVKASPTP